MKSFTWYCFVKTSISNVKVVTKIKKIQHMSNKTKAKTSRICRLTVFTAGTELEAMVSTSYSVPLPHFCISISLLQTIWLETVPSYFLSLCLYLSLWYTKFIMTSDWLCHNILWETLKARVKFHYMEYKLPYVSPAVLPTKFPAVRLNWQ